MLGVFSAMEVAASGLTAERTRMNSIASNLANARTTRTEQGGPYKRLDVVFEAAPIERDGIGPSPKGATTVRVQEVREDSSAPKSVYEPGHPDADANGYVGYPNVNVVEEMVNMITASRAYDAGVTTVESAKSMARSALSIGR